MNADLRRGSLLRRRLMAGWLVLSLCVAMFSYGFAASQFKFFPYNLLRDARTALSAMVGMQSAPEVYGLAQYRTEVQQPTVVKHSDQSPGGWLLMCAGGRALTDVHSEGALAWIMDRSGQIVHVWKNVPGLWDQLEHVTRVPGVSGAISPFAVQVCANGDLLATFHGFNTFPFAVGIACIDRNSQLRWRKENLAHHSFSIDENGLIYVPALEVVDGPVPIGATYAQIESETGKIYHDLILVLDRDGNELRRISLKDALFGSGYHGHLVHSNAKKVLSDDPFHLNDVQVIGRHADLLSGIASDALLVSMRNINTVGILDPNTERFQWLSSGATIGQHSPRILREGIVCLDNLGGDVQWGGTQLVRIGFPSGLPQTLFPRAGVEMPDLCRTVNSGHLEIHPNGQHALLSLTHEGALWEVDLESGRVVWEYIHVQLDERGKPQRTVGSARYIDPPSFLAAKLSSQPPIETSGMGR